jgi:hypothetical protein
VLKRDTAGSIVMHGRGRDLIDVEKAMTFDKENCLWRIAGDAAAVRLTNQRTTILQVIKEANEPVGPRDIADATGMRLKMSGSSWAGCSRTALSRRRATANIAPPPHLHPWKRRSRELREL